MKNAIVIPTAAVQRGPNGTFVYLLKPDQTVAMKMVKVGQQDDVQAVITDGIAAGDTVVTTGFARLQEGTKVEVGQPATTSTGTEAPTPGAEGKPHRRHNNNNGGNGNSGTANATSPEATSATRQDPQQ
jgi:multidrug efflux system membrane fusion protein